MGINNKLSKVQTLDQYGIWIKTSVDTLDADIALDSEEVLGRKQENSLAHDKYDDSSENFASHIPDFPDFPDISNSPAFPEEDTPDIADTSSDFLTDDISDSDILVENFPEEDTPDIADTSSDFLTDDISDSNILVENFPEEDTPDIADTSSDFSTDDISDSNILVENFPEEDTPDIADTSSDFSTDDISDSNILVENFPEEDTPDIADTSSDFSTDDISDSNILVENLPEEDTPDIADTSSDFSTDDISDSNILVENLPEEDTSDIADTSFDFSTDDISDSNILVENFPEEDTPDIADTSSDFSTDDISDSDIFVENFPEEDTPDIADASSDFSTDDISDSDIFVENFPEEDTFLENSPVTPPKKEDWPEDDTFFLRDSTVDENSMEVDFAENNILLEKLPANENSLKEDASSKEVHREENFPENSILLKDIPAEDTSKNASGESSFKDTDSDKFHRFENEYASLNNEIHAFRDQLLKEVSQIKQQIVELQNNRYSRSVEDSATQEQFNGFFAESPDDEIISLTDQELDVILDTYEEEGYLSNESTSDMMPHNEEEPNDSSGNDTVLADITPEIDEELIVDDLLSTDDVLDMDEYEAKIASLETTEQDDSTDSSVALSQMKLGDDGTVFENIEEISLDDIMQYASEANANLENNEDTQDSNILSEYTLENELNETASILDNMNNDFSSRTENTDDEIVISLRDDNGAPSKSDTTKDVDDMNMDDVDMDSLESILEPWEVVENNEETQNDITDLKSIKDTPSLNLPDIDDDVSPPVSGSHSPVAVSSSVPQDDFKNTLQYIDGLLDLLPHGKYQEFVHSEHFGMYKKILEELGIAS